MRTRVETEGHGNDGEADGAESGALVDKADGVHIGALRNDQVDRAEDNDVLCQCHGCVSADQHIYSLPSHTTCARVSVAAADTMASQLTK